VPPVEPPDIARERPLDASIVAAELADMPETPALGPSLVALEQEAILIQQEARHRPIAVRRWIRLAGLVASGLAAAVIVGFALLTIVPRAGLYNTFVVLTPSMEPGIPVGSVVVVVPAKPQTIQVGDVVTTAEPVPPHLSVTHRVSSIEQGDGGLLFRTKGDANSLPDPWALHSSDLAGKVVAVLPVVGYALLYSSNAWVKLGLTLILGSALTVNARNLFTRRVRA